MSNYDITSDNSFEDGQSVNRSAEQRLSERLQEADLGVERFIPVEYKDGSKKPTENGWQSTQYPSELLDGPTGVVCEDGLVAVDDDSHEPGVTAPEQLDELPNTFSTGTMHGGSHLFFKVVGEQPKSRKRPWGDIQSTGKMVVAPGAEFDHAECEDCGRSGVGRYTVLKDAPIAAVNPEDYPQIFGIQTDMETDESTSGESNPTFDVDKRLTFAVEHDKKFSRLWKWGKGGQSTSDDSSRETALAQKLLFYFEGNEKTVREVLNSLSLPKWSERGDEHYRNSVMQAARNYAGNGFDPNESSGGSGGVCRDTAIRVVAMGVVNCLISRPEGQFRTAEVVDSEEVNVQEDQVRKILEALEESDYLQYERSGRKGFWVGHTNEDGNWDIPVIEDRFYEQFTTRMAVNQQRYSWMNNHMQ